MLPRDNQAWPPPWVAPTLAVVEEADRFLVATGAEVEYEDGWDLRSGSFWSGDLKLGVNSWLPSAFRRERSVTDLNKSTSSVPIPVARDLVAFSAAQVVGSGPGPRFVAEIEHQQLLDNILYETDLLSTLYHAAEWCAAYGGVYLRVVQTEPPRVTVVRPDLAVPFWDTGSLASVIFETKLPPPDLDGRRADNRLWWRFLERYFMDEGEAVMEVALYASRDRETVGDMRPLADHPAVASLTDVVESSGLVGVQRLGIDRLPVVYVPNLRSRFTSGEQEEGRSDLTGIANLLQLVDRIAGSVAEEIQLGKPKIIVPDAFITSKEGSRIFDDELNVFTGIMADPGLMTEANMIRQIEFAFNYDARISYLDYFRKLCIQSAGWSAQDFGYDVDSYVETGIALREKKVKTLTTQARKREHFGPGVEKALSVVLEYAGVPRETCGVQVQFPPGVMPSDTDKAVVLESYARSGVLSREEQIRYLRPTWTEEQIAEELAKDPGGYGAQKIVGAPNDVSTLSPQSDGGG